LTPYSKKELAKILANKAADKPVVETVNSVQEREDSSLILTQTLTVRNDEGGDITPEA
jgi:hypothetical protein